MAYRLRPPVGSPVTISLRPKRHRRLALTIGVAMLGGLIVLLTTGRDAKLQGSLVADDHDAERRGDQAWAMASESIQRIGYRNGRTHVLEVVPLGPTAVEVEVRTARAFLAMRASAADAGVDLRLESGFRTVEQQLALYRAWRKGRGNKAALPGRSNHQSGRALDINVVSNPGALAWLEAHAATFGFKRTVKGEPWHWEYVEVEIARAETKRISRKGKAAKSAKSAKLVRQTRRPARRPSSVKRVASSRR